MEDADRGRKAVKENGEDKKPSKVGFMRHLGGGGGGMRVRMARTWAHGVCTTAHMREQFAPSSPELSTPHLRTALPPVHHDCHHHTTAVIASTHHTYSSPFSIPQPSLPAM